VRRVRKVWRVWRGAVPEDGRQRTEDGGAEGGGAAPRIKPRPCSGRWERIRSTFARRLAYEPRNSASNDRRSVGSYGRQGGALQEIVIYEAPGRKIEVQVHTDSLWLSLTQMASLFGVNKPAISLSISRISTPPASWTGRQLFPKWKRFSRRAAQPEGYLDPCGRHSHPGRELMDAEARPVSAGRAVAGPRPVWGRRKRAMRDPESARRCHFTRRVAFCRS
jgi:hypothetical protein